MFLQSPSGEVFESEHPEFHKDCTRLGKAEGKRARAEYCRAELLKRLQPGSTVYTVLRHVSTSGMSRRIDVFAMRDNEPVYLSAYAADLLGWKLHAQGGIVCSGCGMDMGFHLVYALGSAVWPNGTPAPHGTRNGEADTSGGYALKQRWL